MIKKVSVFVVVVALFASAVAVSAQEDRPDRPGLRDRLNNQDRVMAYILEQAGFERGDIAEQLQNGVTLEEIMADVDVVAIINQGVADGVFTQEMADRLIERVENGQPIRPPRSPRAEFNGFVAEQLGLTPQEVAEALRGGTTLRELLENAGLSFEDMVNAAVEQGLMEADAAERLLNRLENGPDRPVVAWRILITAASDATGLAPRELLPQLHEAEVPGDVITANGGDVSAIISTALAGAGENLAELVEAGRISQEQADTRLANLEQRFNDFMNGTLPSDN